MKFLIKLFLGTTVLLQSINALAVEDSQQLAKASLNPFKVNHFAKHIALPFENDTNFGYGSHNDQQNILNFKPVIPFQISANYDLVIRTIAPIFERTPTPNSQNMINGNNINGWSDINPTFFLTPSQFKNFMWGIGPTFFLPTASNNKYIGSGKYSIGPELGVYTMPDNWLLGFLTYNVWSVAGQQNRPSVNQFSFQYLAS